MRGHTIRHANSYLIPDGVLSQQQFTFGSLGALDKCRW